MIPAQDLLIFAAACLLMVLTPGPNMIYLISRSICQGRKPGLRHCSVWSQVFCAHVCRSCRADGGISGRADGL